MHEAGVTGSTADCQGESAAVLANLAARIRARVPEAAAELDAGFRQALVRFCTRYLNRPDESEDAVQEILYKVLRAEHVPDALRPWLYRVARNHCLNLRRGKNGAVRGMLPPASQLRDDRTGLLTRLVRQEDAARVADLLATLSDELQEVLQLRYVDGLSRGEVAEVLDLPESVVKSRIFEGLRRLRAAAGRASSG